jgi:hypothetical protein
VRLGIRWPPANQRPLSSFLAPLQCTGLQEKELLQAVAVTFNEMQATCSAVGYYSPAFLAFPF